MPWRSAETPGLEWGVAIAPFEGESASGDSYIVRPVPDGILTAVVDGVGHGEEAALAARRAVELLARSIDPDPIALVRRCHEALLDTRGVVMSIASLNTRTRSLAWLGVGNVSGHVLRSDPNATPNREVMMTRGGTVGLRLPMLAASLTEMSPGDVFVLATDGLKPGFTSGIALDAPLQVVADRVLSAYGRGTDDALVLIGRYLGLPREPV